MNELVGQTLAGRYEIQQEIGKGGMARVYRALDRQLNRTVALKVLAPQLTVDPEFVKRFEREASMVARLGHPHIVTVYDRGEYEGVLYISMEYIEGRTLHTILKDQGALSLGYCVSILEPLCQALDFAHKQGAVHRDIKPQNIMIATDGRVLLADFGIAQPAEADQEGLTRTGTFMGTPEYISPEQTQKQRVDGKSDLYSLGIVAYEIITGRVPFAGNTPQLLIAHNQQPPPRLSSVVVGLPLELDTIFLQVLAKEPHARYPNASAFLAELRKIADRYRLSLPVGTATGLLADLAQPLSSAGKPTIAIDQGTTQQADQPVIPPSPLPPAFPPPPERPAAPVPIPPPPPAVPPPLSPLDSANLNPVVQRAKANEKRARLWLGIIVVVLLSCGFIAWVVLSGMLQNIPPMPIPQPPTATQVIPPTDPVNPSPLVPTTLPTATPTLPTTTPTLPTATLALPTATLALPTATLALPTATPALPELPTTTLPELPTATSMLSPVLPTTPTVTSVSPYPGPAIQPTTTPYPLQSRLREPRGLIGET